MIPVARRTATGVAWYELGSPGAPALVACHGMALDHRDMLDLVGPFAGRWRIVLWDMPGHGDSGSLATDATLPDMTDACEAVLESAAVDTPLLVGFSFGGMIAQELVRRRRSLAGLVAFGCFAPFLVAPPLAPDAVEAMIVGPIVAGPWPDVRAAFAAACSVREDVRARLAGPIDRLGPDGLATMTRALFGAFAPAEFRLEAPTLVMRGAHDANGAALVDSAKALLRSGPRVSEAVIAGAGHCAHLDRPAATQDALAGFLDTFAKG